MFLDVTGFHIVLEVHIVCAGVVFRKPQISNRQIIFYPIMATKEITTKTRLDSVFRGPVGNR